MKKSVIFLFMVMVSWLGMNAELYNEMTYSKKSTTFSLVAQKAQSVQLNIYTDGTGGKPVKQVDRKSVV